MENRSITLVLEIGNDLVDLVVEVVGLGKELDELVEEEGPDRGLLVVVLDVHVDDVHRLVVLAPLARNGNVAGVTI